MAEQVAKRQPKMPARRWERTDPFRAMQSMMDSMMEDFFGEWPAMRVRPFEWRIQEFTPNIDVIDEDKDIRVNAEIPGMEPNDIDVTITRDALVINGEKKAEHEEEKQGVRYSERSYGSFHRTIPLPVEIDQDKVQANFRNGVLSITLPKSQQALQQAKKVQIKTEAGSQPKEKAAK